MGTMLEASSHEVDEFSWLRDDSRTCPRVLGHLAQQNAAAEQVLASFRHLQDSFQDDIASRVPLVERRPAVRQGNHWYYETRQEGDQYWRLWRSSCVEAALLPSVSAGGAAVGEHEAAGQQGPAKDECILDPNFFADDIDYWDMGSWDVSPCGTRLAYTCDTQGSEGYHVVVRDLEAGVDLATAEAASGGYGSEVFWGLDAHTLFCVEKAAGSLAAQSLVRLTVVLPEGSKKARVEASVVYTKASEEDSFEVHRCGDGTLLVLHIKDQEGSTVAASTLAALAASSSLPATSSGLPAAFTSAAAETGSEQRSATRSVPQAAGGADAAAAAAPASSTSTAGSGLPSSAAAAQGGQSPSQEEAAGGLPAPWQVAATLDEEDGDLLWVDHLWGCWLGTVDTDDAPNGCVCQLLGNGFRVLTEFEAGCEVEQVQLSDNHMAVLLRHRCQFRLLAFKLHQSGSGAACQVSATRQWERQLPVEAGSACLLEGPGFEAPVVWVQQSGLALPVTVLQYHLGTQAETVVQVEGVAGGFDASHYATELLWVERPGGVQVPVHVAYHKQRFRQDGTSPLLLHAYGAYGKKLDPSFNPAELPLLDRGWAVAIAHVRGGGELGWKWHTDGRRFRKHNTFEDLVACVEHLVASRYCCHASAVGWGRSAGGLTMGAALNLQPGLFQGVVLDVPFLDPLNTMLDPSLPLTIKERSEWGDPLDDEEVREYMRSYSPCENIQQAAYPHLLLTAGLHDHRVNYWEPAKYVARMQQQRTDSSRMLLLLTSGKQGHFASSGAGDRLQERALKYAFFAEALGLGAADGLSSTAASTSKGTQDERGGDIRSH